MSKFPRSSFSQKTKKKKKKRKTRPKTRPTPKMRKKGQNITKRVNCDKRERN